MSKSGVSYSWGTKGFRVTKTANGKVRTTSSIPGTGISYSQEFGSKKGSANRQNTKPSSQPSSQPLYNSAEYSNVQEQVVDENAIVPVEFADLVKRIRSMRTMYRLSIFVALLFALWLPQFVILIAALWLVLSRFIYVNLDYSFDDAAAEQWETKRRAWVQVASSQMMWEIPASAEIINKKVNAGASRAVQRKKCTVKYSPPSFIKTSVQPIVFRLSRCKLAFFPDCILIIGKKITALGYDEVKLSFTSKAFVEEEKVPRDSIQLSTTWQKVNKDGSPDKRFSGNRQVPIMAYGQMNLIYQNSVNIEMMFSNAEAIDNLSAVLQQNKCVEDA